MGRFRVSRITVTRAMRDLQTAGLIERRVGSGSFVSTRQAAPGHAFGLLIPDLGETDIFEPICQGMMASPLARTHVLLWGSTSGSQATSPQRAWEWCRQYIERGAAGVFFAPLEFGPDRAEVNDRILAALDRAAIPVVLLDRTVGSYLDPGPHDLVALDNRRAGYVMTHHLLALGCQRVVFVGRREAASTVDAREAGYREAVWKGGREGLAHRIEAVTDDAMRTLLRKTPTPDGIVCANDRTAGEVLHALGRLGRRVPDEVRLVGIDDVGYSQLLPVPLTTYRQPVAALGDTALSVMLDRVARPDRPPRDTLLHGQLVVRASCGSSRGRP
jgi:GntR family transcriptional regulator of arabinose operon